jgi:hypothetical protein
VEAGIMTTTVAQPPDQLNSFINQLVENKRLLETAQKPTEASIRADVEAERDEFHKGIGPLRFCKKHWKTILPLAGIALGAVALTNPAGVALFAAHTAGFVYNDILLKGFDIVAKVYTTGAEAAGVFGGAAGVFGGMASFSALTVGIISGAFLGGKLIGAVGSHLFPKEDELKERLIKQRLEEKSKKHEAFIARTTQDREEALSRIEQFLGNATLAQMETLYNATTLEQRAQIDFHQTLGTKLQNQPAERNAWYEKMTPAEAGLVPGMNSETLSETVLRLKSEKVTEYLDTIKTILALPNNPNDTALQHLKDQFQDHKKVLEATIEGCELTPKQLQELNVEGMVQNTLDPTASQDSLAALLQNFIRGQFQNP